MWEVEYIKSSNLGLSKPYNENIKNKYHNGRPTLAHILWTYFVWDWAIN